MGMALNEDRCLLTSEELLPWAFKSDGCLIEEGIQLRKYGRMIYLVYSLTIIPHSIYSAKDLSKHTQCKGLVQPCVRCSVWMISSATDRSSLWRIIAHSNLLNASCPFSNIFLSTASNRNWAFSVGSLDIWNGFDILHQKHKHTYNSTLLFDTSLKSIHCQDITVPTWETLFYLETSRFNIDQTSLLSACLIPRVHVHFIHFNVCQSTILITKNKLLHSYKVLHSMMHFL